MAKKNEIRGVAAGERPPLGNQSAQGGVNIYLAWEHIKMQAEFKAVYR